MVGDYVPGLGPKTEAPRLNPKADFAAAKLSPVEGFVLSRVDGHTSIAEIVAMSGLGECQTVAILQKLKALLLIVTSAPMSELPPEIAPPSVSKMAALGKEEAVASASGDAAAAAAGEAASGLGRGGPATAAPGPNADGVMTKGLVRPMPPLPEEEIDPEELADGKDLSEETKRRILSFYKRLPVLDYFDRLEVDPEADKQTIRRAFFRLSKEFHPDRYYGKDIGGYKQKLSDVFKAIAEAFDTLSDDARRRAYVLSLRDAAAARVRGDRGGVRGKRG